MCIYIYIHDINNVYIYIYIYNTSARLIILFDLFFSRARLSFSPRRSTAGLCQGGCKAGGEQRLILGLSRHHHHHPEGVVYRSLFCLNSGTVAISKITEEKKGRIFGSHALARRSGPTPARRKGSLIGWATGPFPKGFEGF